MYRFWKTSFCMFSLSLLLHWACIVERFVVWFFWTDKLAIRKSWIPTLDSLNCLTWSLLWNSEVSCVKSTNLYPCVYMWQFKNQGAGTCDQGGYPQPHLPPALNHSTCSSDGLHTKPFKTWGWGGQGPYWQLVLSPAWEGGRLSSNGLPSGQVWPKVQPSSAPWLESSPL